MSRLIEDHYFEEKHFTKSKKRVKFKNSRDAKRYEIRNKRKERHNDKFKHIIA